jgi:lipid-binding SYLF domain-containing protein
LIDEGQQVGRTGFLFRANSRSKGLFAGISLEGSTLRSDGSANEKLYRQKLSAKDIIRGGKVKAPPSASELIAMLNKKTPKNKSDPKSLQ